MVWKNCTLVVMFVVVLGCMGAWAQSDAPQPSCVGTTCLVFIAPSSPPGVTYIDNAVPNTIDGLTQGQVVMMTGPSSSAGVGSFVGTMFNATMGMTMNMFKIWGHNAIDNWNNRQNGVCGQCDLLVGMTGATEVEVGNGASVFYRAGMTPIGSFVRDLARMRGRAGASFGTDPMYANMLYENLNGNHFVDKLVEWAGKPGPLKTPAFNALQMWKKGELTIQTILGRDAALKAAIDGPGKWSLEFSENMEMQESVGLKHGAFPGYTMPKPGAPWRYKDMD